MRYTVAAPERLYNGVVAGVTFSRGRAEINGETDRAALAYFRRRGYTVTPIESSADEAPAEDSRVVQDAPADSEQEQVVQGVEPVPRAEPTPRKTTRSSKADNAKETDR